MEDEFHNTNWTVEGRVGSLEVLYTEPTRTEIRTKLSTTQTTLRGSVPPLLYLRRKRDLPGAGVVPSGTCQPQHDRQLIDGNGSQTHEFRVSTSAENRVRATVGVFYSDLNSLRRTTLPTGSTAVQGPGPFIAAGTAANPVGFGPNFSAQGSSASDPNAWPSAGPYDVLRTRTKAIFGELTADITEQPAITVGARYYDVEAESLEARPVPSASGRPLIITVATIWIRFSLAPIRTPLLPMDITAK